MKKYTITCTPVHEDLPDEWIFDIEAEEDAAALELAESIIYSQWSGTLTNEAEIWANIIYTYEVEDIDVN